MRQPLGLQHLKASSPPQTRLLKLVGSLGFGLGGHITGHLAPQGDKVADRTSLIASRVLSLDEPPSCLSSFVTTSDLSKFQHSDMKLTHVVKEGAERSMVIVELAHSKKGSHLTVLWSHQP